MCSASESHSSVQMAQTTFTCGSKNFTQPPLQLGHRTLIGEAKKLGRRGSTLRAPASITKGNIWYIQWGQQ